MNNYLLMIVFVIYSLVSYGYFKDHRIGMLIVFSGYAFSLIGFLLDSRGI